MILQVQQVWNCLEEEKDTSAVREVDETNSKSAPHLFLAPARGNKEGPFRAHQPDDSLEAY